MRAGRALLVFVLITFVAGTVLLLHPPPAAARGHEVICAVCGKPIVGAVMRADGKSFHPACFTCAICGKPITGSFVARGEGAARRYYHTRCFDDSLALRCANCGAVLGKYYTENGKNYCRACYEKLFAPRCVVCGLPIMDPNYTVNSWQEAAHEACKAKIRSCDICGRTIGGALGLRGVTLADGREICEHCAALGITDPAVARALFDSVAVDVGRFGIHVDAAPVGLDLCGKDVLQRLTGRWQTAGHTEEEALFRDHRLVKTTLTVHILDHLEHDRFAAIAAHELTHVYLYHPGRAPLPVHVEEGFANYIASLYLKSHDSEVSRHVLGDMEADTDPDYGDGYREVRAWVAAHRLDALLADLRDGKVPAGL